MGQKAKQPTLEEMKAQATALLEKGEAGDAAAAQMLKDTPLPNLEDVKDLDPDPEPKPKADDPPMAETVSKEEHDKLLHRFSVLEGMFKKDTLAAKVQELEGRIAVLDKENSDLKAKGAANPLKPAGNVEIEPEKLQGLADRFGVGDEDITSLTDLMKAVSSKAAQDAIAGIHDEINGLKAGAQKSAQEKYIDKLTDATTGFPDAVEVLKDPAFHSYLKDELMLDAVYKEDKAGNATAVLKAIRKYKDTLTPDPKPDDDSDEVERKRILAEQAAGPGRGRGTKPPAPAEKTLTGPEISKFMSAYLNRAPEYWSPDGTPKPKAKALYDKLRSVE